MYIFAHLFDHRLVGHLADHLVLELDRVLKFTIDPDEELGSVERSKAILENVFGQRRDVPQHHHA